MNHLPLFVNNLSKNFKKKVVLDKVSLEVRQGEIFGLIGLNGVGKTTLIKIILGLLTQDSGDATIFGGDIRKKETRKNISYLPEKFSPSQYLKGIEFLSLSLAYYGKSLNPQMAYAMAERFDLDPQMLSHKITKYSKGMGQKIGLISAFLTDVPFLILDEPMSGLDPQARIQLKDLLIEYSKVGRTVFFSSHILADIDEICQRIAILHDNKFVFIGTPQEFKQKYGKPDLERAFLEAIKSK